MRIHDPSPPRNPTVLTEDDRVLIAHCVSLSARAHSTSPFLAHHLSQPHASTIFAFPASWSSDNWVPPSGDGKPPFGDEEVDVALFPSLRCVGSGVVARANAAFLASFQKLLLGSSLQSEVSRAMAEKKRIVFTGHSSGGAVAVLAAIWLLEDYVRLSNTSHSFPLCVTFGAPLVGDGVFSHALKREGWSGCFLQFVMPLDIVPRIPLTPLSSVKEQLQTILHSLCVKASDSGVDCVSSSHLILVFYETLLRSVLSVSAYQACLFMGCTNSILGTLTSFVELSPYKPVGTYVFLISGGQLNVLTNSDAILQLLFYCLQLPPQQQLSDTAYRSIRDHWQYESKINECVVHDVVCLDYLELLSSSASGGELNGTMFGDLELSKEARLCLSAARQWEKQRQSNQRRIDANCNKIQEALKSLNDYRTTCELRDLSYYDSFRRQRKIEDFDANVKRLELAGLWDEIVEMLRRSELPDGFEGRSEWVKLGTTYRRLVEPLDIANYYRHSKNEDTGDYMSKGRPRRYRYTQKWHEQAHRMSVGSSSESCFWAIVEELQAEISNSKIFNEVRDKVMKLESDALGWFTSGNLGKDVFCGNSSFAIWWKTLPEEHRSGSCIAKLVYGEGSLSIAA